MRAHEPPSQPTEMWAGGCEIDFVVNRERFARPVVSHFVFQANPVVPGTTDVSFAFHIEVATGVGKPDDTASAGAKPDQAATAQRVICRSQTRIRSLPSASHRFVRCQIRPSHSLRFSEINRLNSNRSIEFGQISKTDLFIHRCLGSKSPILIYFVFLLLGCGAATVSLLPCDRFVVALRLRGRAVIFHPSEADAVLVRAVASATMRDGDPSPSAKNT